MTNYRCFSLIISIYDNATKNPKKKFQFLTVSHLCVFYWVRSIMVAGAVNCGRAEGGSLAASQYGDVAAVE